LMLFDDGICKPVEQRRKVMELLLLVLMVVCVVDCCSRSFGVGSFYTP